MIEKLQSKTQKHSRCLCEKYQVIRALGGGKNSYLKLLQFSLSSRTFRRDGVFQMQCPLWSNKNRSN